MFGRYWRRLSFEVKSAVVSGAVALVLAAGFFTSLGITGLESQSPGVEAERPIGETVTVERTFTVRGVRTVVRSVRVVPRRTGSTNVLGTAVVMRTVTTPGRGNVVTVPGQARTIVETRDGQVRTSVVTNDRVVTDRRVVTNQRVVTEQRTFTNDRTITNDRTVTDVQRHEVTVPVTIVRTVTDTLPVTQTVTTTQVITETAPPATVTVTVTCPPKGCG
jgi:hypothetical protein